jgi:hypothetical protein
MGKVGPEHRPDEESSLAAPSPPVRLKELKMSPQNHDAEEHETVVRKQSVWRLSVRG